jgi:hypothetical protein
MKMLLNGDRLPPVCYANEPQTLELLGFLLWETLHERGLQSNLQREISLNIKACTMTSRSIDRFDHKASLSFELNYHNDSELVKIE